MLLCYYVIMLLCKSFCKKGYVKINKAEYEGKIKELIAAVNKEKELSQKLLEVWTSNSP